jgi:hypothetical protein
MLSLLFSVIFLNKIRSGRHTDPKFGRRGGGVSYINTRKNAPERRSGLRLYKNNFRNGVLARFVKNTPVFMEAESSLSCLQEPTSDIYHELLHLIILNNASRCVPRPGILNRCVAALQCVAKFRNGIVLLSVKSNLCRNKILSVIRK